MFNHFQHPSAGNRCRPDHHRAHFARFGFGGERFRGPMGPPFGGGRERMFDNGEFQLVLLHLLAEKPSYGYELIKTMEEKLAGGYAPSPGVVYPTLTLLEEEGFTTASNQEGGRKVYTVTEQGREHLAANRQRVDEVLERLQETGAGFERGRSPEFRKSMKNLQRAVLRVAMRARASREGFTPEQLRRITEALDAAAKTVDEL